MVHYIYMSPGIGEVHKKELTKRQRFFLPKKKKFKKKKLTKVQAQDVATYRCPL